MNLANFVQQLPPSFALLQDIAANAQIGLLVVGGAVRDFLFFGQHRPLKDLDIEVYCSDYTKYQQLISAGNQAFATQGQELKFQIFRWQLGEVCLEVSLPRAERYTSGSQVFAHDQFTVDFVYGPIPQYANFCRRDFTINSLGVFFAPESPPQWVDLVAGENDLQKRLLATINKDFTKDPLRLLRLARMQTGWPTFTVSAELQMQLQDFNLSNLDPEVHLWAEAQKAADTTFFQRFFHLVDQYQIVLSSRYLPYRHFINLPQANVGTLVELHAWAHYYLPSSVWSEFPWANSQASTTARRFFQCLATSAKWLSPLQKLASNNDWNAFWQHPGREELMILWRCWQVLQRPENFLPSTQQKNYQYLLQLKQVKSRSLMSEIPADLSLEQRSSYRLFYLMSRNFFQE